MSVLVSFYLWPKDKFVEYSKMAHLVPPDQTKLAIAQAKAKAHGVRLMLVPARSMSAAEVEDYSKTHKEESDRVDKLMNYVKKNAREFEFNWGAGVILDIMDYLKEEKKIELGESLAEYDGEAAYAVMDKKFKDKYCDQLDPAKFSAKQLKFWYVHHTEEQEDLMLKSLESQHFDDKHMKETVARMIKEMKQKKASKHDDFPEAGKAMLDGFRSIHNCLKLVDDKSVFVLEMVP